MLLIRSWLFLWSVFCRAVLFCIVKARDICENPRDIFARKFFAEWRREIFQLCAVEASALYKFNSMKIVYLLWHNQQQFKGTVPRDEYFYWRPIKLLFLCAYIVLEWWYIFCLLYVFYQFRKLLENIPHKSIFVIRFSSMILGPNGSFTPQKGVS